MKEVYLASLASLKGMIEPKSQGFPVFLVGAAGRWTQSGGKGQLCMKSLKGAPTSPSKEIASSFAVPLDLERSHARAVAFPESIPKPRDRP
jgi:hypothetical protein